MEKAYDRTWRHGILQQLDKIELKGNLPLFIQNFLQERIFRVRLCGELSNRHEQQQGVPQGSVLSVTLFGLAINGIVGTLPPSLHHTLYVDDLQLSCRSSTMRVIERQLQAGLTAVHDWATKNGFRFSAEKTVCVHFCK